MSSYTPDTWVVIRFLGDNPHYRVLAGWSGGYLDGDCWRINSGIVKVIEKINHFGFIGSSGSVYSCGKWRYGLRMSTDGVWDRLKELHGDKVEIMPENTDWNSVDWIINND